MSDGKPGGKGKRPTHKILFYCALAMIVLAVLQVAAANSASGRLLAIAFLVCSIALAFAAYFESNSVRRRHRND